MLPPQTYQAPASVRFLRIVFGVFRWLAVILLLFSPLMLLQPTGKGAWSINTPVHLKPESAGEIAKRQSGGPAGLQMRKLSAELELTDVDAAGAELTKVVRWTGGLWLLAIGLLTLVTLDLLWRLFRNLERGEIFTARNFALMRWIGVACLVTAGVEAVLLTWQSWAVSAYVEQHVVIEHLRWPDPLDTGGSLSDFFQAVFRHVHLDDFNLTIGILLLALSEVFRQGLALKQESDLTV